ncbi:hypothetical protein PAMP_008293 [Pampus punctatissimus]
MIIQSQPTWIGGTSARDLPPLNKEWNLLHAMPGQRPLTAPLLAQPTPPSSSLLLANAHAFNRQVLKLIHNKPAALRVVYYKRVFAELSPLMRRARRLFPSTPPPPPNCHYPTATPGGTTAHMGMLLRCPW